MNRNQTRLLTAAQAADRLQVKLETVYAYVSRGLLTRATGAAKQSRFDAAQVERLAVRGRRASTPKLQPLLVTSALTEITDDGVYYRGKDAIALARSVSFEHVAEWLWGVSARESAAFVAPKAATALARAVQSALPQAALPLERLRVIATVLGTTDELRYETSRGPVVATARALIAGMVDGLPGRGHKQPRGERLAARLFARLAATPATGLRLRVLDTALGLCADHALSPSTLAARIAASQRADPYGVVQTGLGALSGALHGAASLAGEELLSEVEACGDPSPAIGSRLRRGERIPGFGQPLHPRGDPRAKALLAALPAAFPANRGVEAALAVERVMRERGLPPPNIDFALAALVRAASMTRGSSEAIMAIARVAGWIGHALEEYASPTKFPWRALYVGPPADQRGAGRSGSAASPAEER